MLTIFLFWLFFSGTRLIPITLALISKGGQFPIGVNLSPLGGSVYAFGYGVDNWDPVSTYVFIDIFKHCTPFYVRSTWDGGKTVSYEPRTRVTWQSNGYPSFIPFTSSSSFVMAMCDIGAGGTMYRMVHTWFFGTAVVMFHFPCPLQPF